MTDCVECGEELRESNESEPGTHFCSGCGMYQIPGELGTTIVGP